MNKIHPSLKKCVMIINFEMVHREILFAREYVHTKALKVYNNFLTIKFSCDLSKCFNFSFAVTTGLTFLMNPFLFGTILFKKFDEVVTSIPILKYL